MAEVETEYNGEYLWVIKGNLLTKMINAKHGERFQSSQFIYADYVGVSMYI